MQVAVRSLSLYAGSLSAAYSRQAVALSSIQLREKDCASSDGFDRAGEDPCSGNMQAALRVGKQLARPMRQACSAQTRNMSSEASMEESIGEMNKWR